jgi:hypothetical protein
VTTKRFAPPQHIGSLLEGAREASRSLAGAGPLSHAEWARIVGPRIASRTAPGRLEGDVLWITASTPVWAQELSLLAGDITERLRARGMAVARIRFRVGPVEQPQQAPIEGRVPRAAAPLPESLVAALAEVDDPELRAAIAEAAGLSLAREELNETGERARGRGAPGDAGEGVAPLNAGRRGARGPQSAG